MKITKEDLEGIVEIVEALNEIKPLIAEVINKSTTVITTLKSPIENLLDFFVDLRVRVVARYENKGFSRSEAIMLAMNDVDSYRKTFTDTLNRVKKG